MDTLGERIRKLRKQQKLTLEALAGNTLTKGMLSLIENNKANPSMESLSYIAERLGVDVSELLEEVSNQELREVLGQAEKLFHTEFDDLSDEFDRLIALINPYLPKLTQGYESARLLELYSRTLHFEKIDGWQTYSDRAAALYEQMNITQRRATIGIFRSMVHFPERNYKKALEILQNERSEIEQKNTFIDPMTRLDFDYTEAILLFAVGNSDEALKIMESAIEFSKDKQVFYQIDHLYRLATFHAMMTGDDEKLKYYMKKIELYGEFTDDKNSILFVNFIKVHRLTSFEKKYKTALDLLEKYDAKFQLGKVYKDFHSFEKGKALFGLHQYKSAIEEFEKVKIRDFFNHPFDLSILYEGDAYRALCYLKLGNRENALAHAKLAYDNIAPMPQSPYKDFIIATYEKIRNSQ
ncbi:helix-turn-helix domain-containing protein [Sporosarcina ureilytica]|uniref:HTH cro/C1-type domain-containing protein n=1 Tax=Sporosarcina ureilytica TaxID=298596 RepID=A0A1D8JD73_9BACL|nr:helix-turn-helix transcriptional regulator [Sporosarcina ureilytica]AOV06660.1 hypothetical protein BI350_02915 [Sporosarcina ureilytica]